MWVLAKLLEWNMAPFWARVMGVINSGVQKGVGLDWVTTTGLSPNIISEVGGHPITYSH